MIFLWPATWNALKSTKQLFVSSSFIITRSYLQPKFRRHEVLRTRFLETTTRMLLLYLYSGGRRHCPPCWLVCFCPQYLPKHSRWVWWSGLWLCNSNTPATNSVACHFYWNHQFHFIFTSRLLHMFLILVFCFLFVSREFGKWKEIVSGECQHHITGVSASTSCRRKLYLLYWNRR